MFNLTESETKVLIILTQSCLDGMGGTRPSDLESDEYTWIEPSDLPANEYSPKQRSGFFSSLIQKGVIEDWGSYNTGKQEWVLATAAWRYADTIWDNYKK